MSSVYQRGIVIGAILLAMALTGARATAQQKIVFIESEKDVIEGCVVLPGPNGKGQVLMGPLVPSGSQAKPDIYSMTYFVDGTNRIRNLVFSFDRGDKFVGYNEVVLGDGRILPNPPFQQIPASGRFGESHLLPLSDDSYVLAQKRGMKLKWKAKGKSASTTFEIPPYFFTGFQQRAEKMLGVVVKAEPASPYIQGGSIGKTADDKGAAKILPNELSHLKGAELIGQTFIFMPQRPSDQGKAYQFGSSANTRKRLPYENYVGKMIKIITFNTDQEGGEHYGVQVEETGEIITLEGSDIGAKLPNLALKRDIDHAREKFIGKKVWLRGHAVYTYNEAKDATDVEAKPRFTQFTVKNVVLGMQDLPVRFILEGRDGDGYYVDVHMSLSNTRGASTKLFDFLFYDTNPREIYDDWTDEVFRLVSLSKVALGMTKRQVTVALGSPDSVTTTEITGIKLDQWYYKDQVVTFNNGSCSSLQTLK